MPRLSRLLAHHASSRSTTMPDLDDVLAAHVAWLRLLRRSERTIYERQRAVIRLATWLARYDGGEIGSTSSASPAEVRFESVSPELRRHRGDGVTRYGMPHAAAGDLILDATAADLVAWRASLTVGDRGLLTHTRPIPGLYPGGVPGGLIPLSPAQGPPFPPGPPGVPP